MSPSVRAGWPRYSIFVLSAWDERSGHAGEAPAWRFSLEGSQIDGRKGFGSLPELVAFLEAWTRSAPPADTPDAGPPPPSHQEGSSS